MNYLYWGSMRWPSFGRALVNLKPRRDRMVLLLQSHSRVAALIPGSVERALRRIGYDHADVLLLGLWNRGVPVRILDAARRLRDRGLVRHIAVSSHNRPLIVRLGDDPDIDVLHLRYNAAHTGAEADIFPHLPPAGERPGIVAFTATSWGQLMNPKRVPAGERAPTAADCYRFVLSNPAVDVCIAGPSNEEQARAASDALHLGPLDVEELAWMRRVGHAVHG
jgi:aryl-alcohol dehydrogenase-like predicted oxidoreductase